MLLRPCLPGINKNSAAEETEEGDWDATFAINTKGVFLCCQVGCWYLRRHTSLAEACSLLEPLR